MLPLQIIRHNHQVPIYHLHVGEPVPLRLDVEQHPVHRPVEGGPAAEEDGQDQVGEQGGEVHSLPEGLDAAEQGLERLFKFKLNIIILWKKWENIVLHLNYVLMKNSLGNCCFLPGIRWSRRRRGTPPVQVGRSRSRRCRRRCPACACCFRNIIQFKNIYLGNSCANRLTRNIPVRRRHRWSCARRSSC